MDDVCILLLFKGRLYFIVAWVTLVFYCILRRSCFIVFIDIYVLLLFGENPGDNLDDILGENLGDNLDDILGKNLGDNLDDILGKNLGDILGDNPGDIFGDNPGENPGDVLRRSAG